MNASEESKRWSKAVAGLAATITEIINGRLKNLPASNGPEESHPPVLFPRQLPQTPVRGMDHAVRARRLGGDFGRLVRLVHGWFLMVWLPHTMMPEYEKDEGQLHALSVAWVELAGRCRPARGGGQFEDGRE
jgi:hypothetical protein